MILISHRGNLTGPDKSQENKPEYIQKAISSGFDCEIDLWKSDKGLFTGHDNSQYKISSDFLLDKSKNLWIHCKNYDSILWCEKYSMLNYFWHETDKITLTSKNFIWAYPGNQPIKNSIAVLPERFDENQLNLCKGICSDYIIEYKAYENI
jgi:hypothetical protein